MSLSEQSRLDLLKYATQTAIEYYPGDKITHAQIEGFYSFLLRLASEESAPPIDLSGESLPTLRHLAEHAQNLSLLRAAALELSKRRGDV